MTYHGYGTPPTAVGDIIVGAGANISDRVAVGSDGQVLNADSSVSGKGVAWANPSEWQARGISTQTDDYTLVLADAGKIVSVTKASGVNLTVPPNASVAFPVGTKITIYEGNAAVTVVAGAGVTVNVDATYTLVLAGQHSVATLWKLATNTWVLTGDLVAA